MDEASLRLRLAARTIFDACYPCDDFEKAEADNFPRYRSSIAAAAHVLEVRLSDLPPRHYLTAAAVTFEIRFALGQAPASLYVDARSKDRGKRERAIGQLVDLVAARFARIEMSRALAPGWTSSPFEHLQVRPGR